MIATVTEPDTYAPATASQAAARSHALATILGDVFLLGTILAINFFVRHTLDQAGTRINSFMHAAWEEQLPEIYALPWWRYFLPIECLTGSWCTTSLLLVHWLEQWLPSPAHVFYLTNAIMVTTAYALSFAVFRSRIFSVTLALCFALTTFNHHVYLISGTVMMPLVISYLMFFLFCQYKLLEPGSRFALWIPVGVFSMLLYALAYEGWLDCVACMGLVYPFLIVLAWRAGDYRRAKIAAGILMVTIATMFIYVAIKRSMGDGQGRGSESDVVFNYGRSYLLLAVEDVIGHLFTHFFVTITTYTPPLFFNGSYSSWKVGAERIIELQNGYDPGQAHLLRYHHLFYWRFYAGFAAAVFLYALWKNIRVCWRMPNHTSIAVFVFLMMTLLSGATHSIVKARPMHSAPFLGYHSYFGVVGFSLLLALGAWWALNTFQRRWLAWALIALLWLNLGYCALARPAFLSHMATQCGFNAYPDAWQNFKNTVRQRPVVSDLKGK